MAQIATNDPNYFLNQNVIGDFNDVSQDASGFGSLPAVEKNQTYFVYSNGVTSAEPEFIEKSLYNIKYLIDENGNVYKPNSDNISLNNLKNNFFNRPINVESQTPTQVLSNMLGEQIINDIGSVQPLIFSENGPTRDSYEPTMSFGIFGSTLLATSSFNYNDITFTSADQGSGTYYLTYGASGNDILYKDGNQTIGTQTIDLAAASFPPGNAQSQFDPSTGEYTFYVDSLDYGTDVSFYFRWNLKNIAPLTYAGALVKGQQAWFPPIWVYMRLELSTDNGSTWSNIPITNESQKADGTENIIGNINIDNELQVNIVNQNASQNEYVLKIRSIPQYFNQDNKIRAVFKYNVINVLGNYTTSTNVIENYGFSFKAFTNYSSDLLTSAPYWDGSTWPTSSNTPQWVTASAGLSGFMFTTPSYVYNPTSSLLNTTPSGYGFNKPILPLNPQPGDYIRFEYDKNKTSRIYEVKTLNDGSNRVALKIYPTIPTGSLLDHFVITRMVNDGGNFLVPVSKVAEGNFTSFIKPKYTTQTLNDNLPTIINNLEKDGLLTTLT